MATVNLDNISKSYGKTEVLRDINLDIKDGEFVVLVGPSGCGKSTLLRMICGLEDITSGELKIGDKVVNSLAPAKRGIAMVFQSYALYPHMNVYKNMAFGLKVAKQDKAQIEARIKKAAEILKIDHLLERLPKELSGGQRQRVAIGRAIVREPQLFLFDEPLSNLDAALRVQTRLEIAKLHQQLGTTIIYVTHDQVEAMTLGDKIVVLSDGDIQQYGSPLELYQQPSNLFVATFIGSPKMNLIKGTLAGIHADNAVIELEDGQSIIASIDAQAANIGDKVTLGLRSEHLYETEKTGASQRFHGKINLVEHLGEANFIYATLSNGQDIVVKGDGNREVSLGAEIELYANPDSFYAFGENGQALPRLRPGNMTAANQIKA